MDSKVEYSPPINPEPTSPIETPDGRHVFVFRYENPDAENNHPNSETSKDELVGNWYTHSLKALRTYILMRQPGGNIRIAQIPKEKIEELKAANHEIAKDMDIEPLDNYTLPDNLVEESRVLPFTVSGSGTNKFMLGDVSKIQDFIDKMHFDLVNENQLSNTSMPGNLSPDRNSSMAPPPMDTRS